MTAHAGRNHELVIGGDAEYRARSAAVRSRMTTMTIVTIPPRSFLPPMLEGKSTRRRSEAAGQDGTGEHRHDRHLVIPAAVAPATPPRGAT